MNSDWLEETQMEKLLGEWMWDKKQKKRLNWVQDDVKMVENFGTHFE